MNSISGSDSMAAVLISSKIVMGGSVRITAVIMALTLAACATTIPETDSEPPEVRLTVTGPGLGRKEMSNPPQASWTAPDGSQYFNLQPGVRYNFILSVSDDGGVERAHLRFPANFTVSDVTPAGVVESNSAILKNLTLTGNRSDPRTGLVISGTVEGVAGTSFEFQAEGDDFGGASGRSNQRFMSVDVFVDFR